MLIPKKISTQRQLYINAVNQLTERGSRGYTITELREALNLPYNDRPIALLIATCRVLGLVNGYGNTKAMRYVVTSRGKALADDLNVAMQYQKSKKGGA